MYLGLRGPHIVPREDDGVEARIPEPLVRVVVAGGDGVLVAVCDAAIFFKKFARLAIDIHPVRSRKLAPLEASLLTGLALPTRYPCLVRRRPVQTTPRICAFQNFRNF